MTERELKGVAEARVSDWGHAITLVLDYSDNSKESIKIPYELAASVILAINQTAAAAERTQRAQPGQLISLEIPITATDVHAGIVGEGGSVAFRFVTTMGAPLVIAMSRDLGRRAIELLSGVLENRDKQPPSRPS